MAERASCVVYHLAISPFRRARTDSHADHVDGYIKAPLTHEGGGDNVVGVSVPVVLRLPPGHVHSCYGLLLAHPTGLVNRGKATAFLLLAFPGGAASGRSSAIPASGRTFRGSPGRPRHRAFFLGTRMEEAPPAPSRECGGAGAAPLPKTTTPANQRRALPSTRTGPGW
jgi:hypothetical protein